MNTPILFVGDNPALPGGLSRITRDLSTLAATMPEFRVGALARGIGNTRMLPFSMYPYPESGQWGQEYIEGVWNDFSGGEAGVIMTTDDLSRRGWFANPGQYGSLERFLGQGRNFRKWAYTPVDSIGPSGNSLGGEMATAAMGYDRVLAASEWGRDVLIRSGRTDADWLPHGLDFSIWKPHEDPRPLLGWSEEDIWAGCVMSNQSRKDWPVAFEALALLNRKYGNRFHAWLHVDLPIRYWNLYALAMDYGVAGCISMTSDKSDQEMALRYSACDVTILPSGGEGFGYPVAESMACGTACIVTDYAAGQELVHEECRVSPVCYRLDTIHNVQRAVLSGYGFAGKAEEQIERKHVDREYRGEELRDSTSHLDWQKLKYPWMKWLRAGLK